MGDADKEGASLSEQEHKMLAKYGRLPNRKDLVQHKLKERKFFDSGDYALCKAGHGASVGGVGSEHPSPDSIPHSTPPNPNHQPHAHSAVATAAQVDPAAATSSSSANAS